MINPQNRSLLTNRSKNNISAFTIVELLVVIVVIGILAAITIVSYSGISSKAIAVSLSSDLDSSKKLLALYNVDHGYFPSTLDSNNCPETPTIDAHYCLKPSNDNTLDYTGGDQDYILTATNTPSGQVYAVTPTSSPVATGGGGGGGGGSTGTLARILGGVLQDSSYDSIKDSDGNYVIVGSTESFGAGDYDAYLAKYSATGTLLWSKTWGGTDYDDAYSITSTSDNGYVIAGDTSSFGNGRTDAYIAKFTSDGSLAWDKTYGGVEYDAFYDVQLTADNGFIAVGGTENAADTYGDALIVKYDSTGNVQWNKSWGGNFVDGFDTVTQLDDGGFVAAGSNGSFSSAYGDVGILKFSSAGVISWAKSWGGEYGDDVKKIIKTSDGGFAITGLTLSFGADAGDSYLAKYTSDGTFSWSKSWGGEFGMESGHGLVQLSDGSYVVVGFAESYGNYSDDQHPDAFITKLDSSGDLIWNRTWGDYNRDVAYGVFVDSDKLVVNGYTESYDNQKSSTNIGDIFMLKLSSDGGLGGCESPVCQSQVISSVSRTPTQNTLPTSTRTLTASAQDPSATVSSPSSISTPPLVPNDFTMPEAE